MWSWISFEPRRATWSTQGGWWWRRPWATWPGLWTCCGGTLSRHAPEAHPRPRLGPPRGEGPGTDQQCSQQVDTKNQGRTALQVAAYLGQVELLRLLLQARAGVDLADEEGNTALHYAALG